MEQRDNQVEQDMENTSKIQHGEGAERWPALAYETWRETCQTLHLWTQVVGKVRMALSPFLNHWWHVTLYVTSRGLTTSAIPSHGGSFDVSFDFIEHTLIIRTSEGTTKESAAADPPLRRRVLPGIHGLLARARHRGHHHPLPSEVQNPIRCDVDGFHASYDALYAQRFWRILLQTEVIMQRYRSPFVGKSSPVHFFWGSFDLTLTLFSGRRAPKRPGADRMTREAYSHEVISCGFWPGDDRFPALAFYSYTSPESPGLPTTAIRPQEAFYNHDLGVFLLRYDDVRSAPSPEQALLAFFQSTYRGHACAVGPRGSGKEGGMRTTSR